MEFHLAMDKMFKIKAKRIADLATQVEMFVALKGWSQQEFYLVCRFLAIFYEEINGAKWHDELVVRSEFIAYLQETKAYPGGPEFSDPPGKPHQ
jgi:hypothetical protein